MGHSSVRIKVRRRKVAALAAYSRQFSVKNNTIPQVGLNTKKVITMWHEIRTSKFDTPVFGKMFEIDEDGHYHLIEREFDPTPLLINHKQPKRLMKLKKRKYGKKHETTNGVGGIMMVQNIKRPKINEFLHYTKAVRIGNKTYIEGFKNYPYHLPKMNRVEYMEALVKHKTEKWERKNPQPLEMFAEDVERWKQKRQTAIERIRDFVVSVYDKLLLTGRFKINKKSTATYQEKKIAEIKDINGEGHRVNDLDKDSKLLKKAQKEVNKVHSKHPNLVAGNLRDHKKQKGRIILPQAA